MLTGWLSRRLFVRGLKGHGAHSLENSGLTPRQLLQREASRWVAQFRQTSPEMVAAQGLVTRVYVAEEGPSLQFRTNGRFGSICRGVGDDRFLRISSIAPASRDRLQRAGQRASEGGWETSVSGRTPRSSQQTVAKGKVPLQARCWNSRLRRDIELTVSRGDASSPPKLVMKEGVP